MKNILKFITIFLIIGSTSCKKDKKDPDPTPVVAPAPTTGTLKIEFEHVVDTTDLVFNHNYVNAKGDTFTVTKLRYYISNIILTKNDNSTFVEPNSYHLLDYSDPASTLLSIANVPFDSYKAVSFMLGVDSIRNISGAQTGDLDPAKGMFWSWSTGYIMFKFEGTSPKSGDPGKILEYHLGGFGGVNKVQRNYNFNFASTTANVSSSITPQIHLSVDVNELFKTPNLINFVTQFSTISAGANAKILADNYADMISFKHVHN